MKAEHYRYIYGPVSSWRLGGSLGIDPISESRKICSFDCVYCQLGRTKALSRVRRNFVPVKAVVKEIKMMKTPPVDYITFSGAGEPTLAKNIGAMIRAVRKIRKEKIAVITNASLLSRKDVRRDLLRADFVLAKLDASSEKVFKYVDRPMPGIRFASIHAGLRKFRREFRGRLALQIMLVPANVDFAEQIAKLAKRLSPDEIQLNTPLRPCMVNPLPKKTMGRIESVFRSVCGGSILLTNVYHAEKQTVYPVSGHDTLRRRGKTA